jgi:hypothetical protein
MLNVFTTKLVSVIVLTDINPAVEPVIVAVTLGTPEKYVDGLNVIVNVPLLVVPDPYKVRLTNGRLFPI